MAQSGGPSSRVSTLDDEVAGRGEAMVAIADAVHREVDDLVLATVRRVAPALPRGMALHPTLDADVRSAVSTTVETAIALIADDRRLSIEEAAMFAATARRRARQGIPADLSKKALMVALTGIWERVVAAVSELPADTSTTAALGRVGTLLAHFGELVAGSIGNAYGDERPRTRDDESQRAQLLADVLSGGLAPDSVSMEMQRAGIAATTLHGLMLLAVPTPHHDRARLRAALATLRGRLPRAVAVPLTTSATGHATVAVAESCARWHHCTAVAEEVARSGAVLVYVSPPVPMAALAGGYARAARLLYVAQRMHMTPRVLESRDLRVASLLDHAAVDRGAFIAETIGAILSLPEHQREPLLATLRALSEVPLRGGVRAAASALNVHLKTVYYRLNRIRQLTGLDHDVPAQRMQLAIALELVGVADAAPAVDTELVGVTSRAPRLHTLDRVVQSGKTSPRSLQSRA
jgi:hypothetical protein